MRLQKASSLDHRIAEIKAEIVQGNAIYNTSKFKGYIGREKEAEAYFEHVSKIPAVYRPYIEWRRIPGYHSTSININKLGYRGKEFSIQKAPGTYRILVYGGSTTWGTGALRDVETLPGHLQRILRERMGNLPMKIEVINCGETGYNSTQELVFLTIEGIYLNPDLVIFYDGGNDTSRGFLGLPAGFPNQYRRFEQLLTEPIRAQYRKVFTIDNELEYLENQRRLVWKSRELEILKRIYLSTEIENKKMSQESVDYTKPEEYAVRHFYNLKIANAIGDKFGFRVIGVIQPLPMHDKPLHPEERQILNYLEKKFSIYSQIIQYHRKYYREYAEMMINLCSYNNIALIDLRGVLRSNNSPIYIDNIHMTSDGYSLVADKLASILITNKYFTANK